MIGPASNAKVVRGAKLGGGRSKDILLLLPFHCE